MRNRYIWLVGSFLGLLWGGVLSAQGVKTEIRRGNKAYQAGDYAKAREYYSRARELDSLSSRANFAMGNVLYQQENWDEALPLYLQVLSDKELSHSEQADVYHNVGNIHLKKKAYQQAIQAYEESLIRRPEDDETRYNLVLAQKLLQRQQNQQNQDNQQQNKQQNQQGDQPPKSGEQPPSQQEPPKEDKKQGEQGENNQGSSSDEEMKAPPQMTKQQAEQLLNSYKQDDDKTRRKVEQLQRKAEAEHNKKSKRRW